MADAEPVVTKSEPEAEMAPGEDVAIQSYPSPTADGQDGGPFYNASADSEQHHQLDLGEQEANEGQLEQPPTPRQQMRHAITSVEELQLAAQLSQGIAHNMPLMDSGEDHPMEHVVVPRHDMDQHEQDPQNHAEQLHHEAMHQDSMHHDHLHQEHMSQDAMSQDHISQEHLSQEEIPQDPLPQDHMPQEHLPQDHIPQDHMAQDHPMSQDHLAQDHLAQDHMHQGHLHGDMHQGHMHQQHDHLQQQEHEQMAEHEQDLAHALPQDQQDQQGHPQPQQPEYAHNPQHQVAQPPPQFQSGTQPMSQFHPLYHLPIPDNTPPRKRSKVSRACDECRRKKVKCDAKSETGEHACSNCRRANARCLFSRIPQKRGPSKGYIKELADRINHIEGKLASEGNNHNVDALSELLGQARRESSDVFAQPGDAENGRKRPHSSISGADLGTPASSRQPTWSSEPRPDAGTRTERQRPPFSVDELAPTPVGPQGEPGVPDDFPEHTLSQLIGGRNINATAYNGYFDVVHPCFPLLPGTKDRMTSLLGQCPPQLRDAFVEAFNAAMQSFPSFTGPYASGDLAVATRLVMECEANSPPRSFIMNLVRLQALTLIAIAIDNQGPASLTEDYAGPAKESILGHAVGLAYRMRLHTSLAELDVEGGIDLESNESIAQRCWWVLVMLDRWNAVSTASPLFIPNESVVLLPKLNALVGDNVMQLARLSTIMSGFSLAAYSAPKSMTEAPALGYMMHVSMELFRDFIPQHFTPQEFPTLHLGYWHCRLLAYLFQINTKPTDLMWVCKKSASMLLDHPLLITPLTHHFFCLTTLALLEVRKLEATRDEASALLKDLLHCSSAPSAWDAVIRERITGHMRPSTAQGSVEAAASQGTLQHLADIATAAELNAAEAEKDTEPATAPTVDEHGSTSMDLKSLILGGYLNVMAK